MYNRYFHEIMIHVTRPCRICGNLEVRQLIECPAPDYDLYPICYRCDQVMDDYDRITDYDAFSGEWEWPEPDNEWEDHLAECGMYQDGHCTMAGSEWCDFECLIRRQYECEMEEE